MAMAMELTRSGASCIDTQLPSCGPSPSVLQYSGLSLLRHTPSFSSCRRRRLFGYGHAPAKMHRQTCLHPVVSFGGILDGFFKKADDGEATRKKYEAILSSVNSLETKICALSDDELRQKTVAFKERSSRGESLDSLLPVSARVFSHCLK
mgnify:FL=1